MKKYLSLALVICLSLVSAPVFAADNYLALNKGSYAQGETITVTTTNITEQMQNDKAFVGIYKVGAGHRDWGEYHYPKAGTDILTFTAPVGGDYEMRLYRADGVGNADAYGAVFVTSVPFTGTGFVPVYPAKDDFDWNLVNFATGTHSFTGTFETNYTRLSMLQKGSSVTGKYPGWDDGRLDGTVIDGVLYGYWYEEPLYAPPHDAGQLVFVMHADGRTFTGWWRYGNSGGWSVWSAGDRNMLDVSGWALEEVSASDALGLIPDSFRREDLTKPITRAEFAAVSVKAYEAMSGQAAIPAASNPFTDTNDPEVLKAYNTGITTGMSADTFDSNALINREQAATMLARVFKKVYMSGWTIGNDANFPLQYTKPAPFADDANISDWAKDSVYFMVANEIIKGVGDNKFAPKNTTSVEEIEGYANATREQALIIAVRMIEKLK